MPQLTMPTSTGLFSSITNGPPLSPVQVLRPAVMTNLLGDLWRKGEPQWGELFAEPHGTLHLYGKSPRPGRKMGHMIHTAATVEEALTAANNVFARLA